MHDPAHRPAEEPASEPRPFARKPSGPLIAARDTERCACNSGCIRACPVKAIRTTDNTVEVIQDKCIACGACVASCSGGRLAARDDLPGVRELLAGDRPVVAVLATEFVAAMHPLTPLDVETALETIGFHAVESTVLGEELVALEYEALHARGCGAPALRSTCPVVVDYVERFQPALVGALAPIVPPYVAQARLVKALYPGDVAVVYVTPCYARKDEFADAEFGGAVDAAIDFFELKRLIAEMLPDDRYRPGHGRGEQRPEPLKELSLTDGFPRSTLASHSMDSGQVAVVRGVGSMERFLDAVARGETAPPIVDLLNCEGCIDGPTVSPGLSVFTKRTIEAAARRDRPSPSVRTRELLKFLPTVDLVRAFRAHPFVALVPDDAMIDAVLREGEFARREDAIDCGGCGYPTCVEHAVAVWRGDSSWERCYPLQTRRLERAVAELSELATVDPLTELWNRRVFMNRLAEEVSRFSRYGSPVALLMIDLDNFKMLNDTRGHAAGDDALRRLGRLVMGQFRVTDIAARYGGDEFAVILPGTNKTEAFAAAEKLRVAVRDLGLRGGRNGDGDSVTASIGVASVGEAAPDAERLLEAADRALYRAKEAGRDAVMLAPG